ncbi:hypothetical protein CIB48_g2498 [Xylaria polymorpha]|nr:hypothetical protein CIB48_g2498 [Xylaria polymorpha]
MHRDAAVPVVASHHPRRQRKCAKTSQTRSILRGRRDAFGVRLGPGMGVGMGMGVGGRAWAWAWEGVGIQAESTLSSSGDTRTQISQITSTTSIIRRTSLTKRWRHKSQALATKYLAAFSSGSNAPSRVDTIIGMARSEGARSGTKVLGELHQSSPRTASLCSCRVAEEALLVLPDESLSPLTKKVAGPRLNRACMGVDPKYSIASSNDTNLHVPGHRTVPHAHQYPRPNHRSGIDNRARLFCSIVALIIRAHVPPYSPPAAYPCSGIKRAKCWDSVSYNEGISSVEVLREQDSPICMNPEYFGQPVYLMHSL